MILKFSPIGFNEKCNYLYDNIIHNHNSKEYISNLKVCCNKIIPFVKFYQEQISSYNCTAHNILTNETSFILPEFPKARQEKKSIIALLITVFIALACEGITSYLHKRRQKALHTAVVAMENKVNLQHNRIIHLENWMAMYCIYNSESLEKLNNTVYEMHNTTIPNEKLFASMLNSWHTWYFTKDGVYQYATNSILYLKMIKEKYLKMYKEFINQL